MNAETPLEARTQPLGATWIARASLGAALAALTYNLIIFLVAAFRAIRFPFGRDYGEGIVWQQMRLMFEGKGYGPIDGFPAIVFHYPPVYHSAVQLLASGAGLDPLMAGRLISFSATLVCALVVGKLAFGLRKPGLSLQAAAICGGVAGLSILCLVTVEIWALVMRVDMLAIALGLAGFWFGVRSITGPRQIYLAALCFVAAFLTKQTSVAAPAAVFAILFVINPRTAWRGTLVGVGVAGTAVAALTFGTNGGFLRHLLSYNLNRVDWTQLKQILALVMHDWLFFAVFLFGLIKVLHERLPAYQGRQTWAQRRNKLAADPADAALLMVLVYFFLKTLMCALVAKSGANINYLIEWMLVGAVFIGKAVEDAASAAVDRRQRPAFVAALPPVALGMAALFNGLSGQGAIGSSPARQQRLRDFEQLEAMVRAATLPVISDDMVVVLRGGKEVVWEPAIFAELASTGVWDERPFVARIRDRRFGFFVTEGDWGDPEFDSRYTPAVRSAMAEAYPRKCQLGNYVIHLPTPSNHGPAGQKTTVGHPPLPRCSPQIKLS